MRTLGFLALMACSAAPVAPSKTAPPIGPSYVFLPAGYTSLIDLWAISDLLEGSVFVMSFSEGCQGGIACESYEVQRRYWIRERCGDYYLYRAATGPCGDGSWLAMTSHTMGNYRAFFDANGRVTGYWESEDFQFGWIPDCEPVIAQRVGEPISAAILDRPSDY